MFPILLPDVASRIRVRATLQGRGIQTSHHYPPVHRFDFYRSRVSSAGASLPRTEDYSDRELTLPLHPNLTPEEIDWIVESIKEGLVKKR